MIRFTPASELPMRAAPWLLFPHCPSCHRRLVDASGRRAPTAFAGQRCPHCQADLGREE
jgi:hypothetical protein